MSSHRSCLFTATLVLVGCESSQAPMGAATGYDLTRPVASFALPAELAEISGLAAVDAHTVACVEDETGTLFFVDVTSGAVTQRLSFGKDGDYEGLARLDDAFWVLRSDGRLLELRREGERMKRSRRLDLELAHEEVEGLEAAADGRALLVAPKSAPHDKGARDVRRVYRLDPAAAEPVPTVLFETTTGRIAADLGGLGLHAHPDVRFSSIAEQPGTGRYFALSGPDRALLVFTADGTVCGAWFFPRQDLPQPEGLTFLPSGDLVITSEADRGPARLVVYRRVSD